MLCKTSGRGGGGKERLRTDAPLRERRERVEEERRREGEGGAEKGERE